MDRHELQVAEVQDLRVFHKGKFMYALNPELVERQHLTNEQIKEIIALHVKKLDLFEEVEAETSRSILRMAVPMLTKIESEMQLAWGFGVDENRHQWYRIPKCTCPKSDNVYNDRGVRSIRRTCIMHGDLA